MALRTRRNRILGAILVVVLVALAGAVVLWQTLGKGGEATPGLLNTAARGINLAGWLGEYYAGVDLAGEPAMVRDDAAIDFDWGQDAPTASMPIDNFSVRWTRSVDLEADTYSFFVRSDDGVRVWVDGKSIIDEWHPSAGDTYTAELDVDAGAHLIKVEYYEQGGWAQVQFGWAPLEADLYPDWKGEYWGNVGLTGAPLLVQNEGLIDFDWGLGGAAAGLPVDNWSARWTRELTLEAGAYDVTAVVDDGFRMWVDGVLVLQSWQDGGTRSVTTRLTMDGKPHQVRVEYYERGGEAEMRVQWDKVIAATPTPTPTATRLPSPTPTRTSTPTPGPTPFPTVDPRYPDWKGMYWANMEMRGSPSLVQNEGQIAFDWGMGSAAAGLPADRFSARWERWVDFAPGTYTFSALADNGIRFYLDGVLLIDEWYSNGKVIYTVERQLSGRHFLAVEYYDNAGAALVRFGW